MDRFQKFSVYLLIVLSATVSLNIYHALATPAPSRSTTVEPGWSAPCTYNIFLDGTTPVAHPTNGGVNTVGSAGQDPAAFINSLSGPNVHDCLEKGTYSISDAIYLDNDGESLTGEGSTTLIKATTAWNPSKTILNNNGGLIEIYGTRSNITLSNLKLQLVSGMTHSVANVIGIHGGSPSGNLDDKILVQNVEFDGATVTAQYGMLIEAGVRNSRFIGNYVHEVGTNAGSAGIAIQSSSFDSYGIVVTQNNVRNIADDAIVIAAGSSGSIHDVTVSQNVVSKNGQVGAAIKLDSTGSAALRLYNVAVLGNTADTSSVNVEGCLEIFGANARDVSYTGNVCAITGSGTWQWGITTPACARCTFSQNVIGIVQTAGFDVQPATDIRFIGNEVKLSAGNATEVKAAGSILDTAARVDFIDNTFYGYGTMGFEQTGLVTPITLRYIDNNFVGGCACANFNKVFLAGSGITHIVRYNINVNPINQMQSGNTIITASGTKLSFFGTATAPSASTTYTLDGADVWNFTSTGGTGVVLTIKDPGGNCLVCGATTITDIFLPIGATLNFGAFSVAPTIKLEFN